VKWFIIAIVLLAAFGPVLWLVPSRRDRLLTRMRSQARTRGLRVEVTWLPDPDPVPEARVSAGGKLKNPTIAGASYQLDLPSAAGYAPTWSLVRAVGDGPIQGWRWRTAPAGDGAYWHEVAPLLERLPTDVLSCEAGVRVMSCFWRERANPDAAEDAVDSIADILGELAALQQSRHAARLLEIEQERARLEGDESPAS